MKKKLRNSQYFLADKRLKDTKLKFCSLKHYSLAVTFISSCRGVKLTEMKCPSLLVSIGHKAYILDSITVASVPQCLKNRQFHAEEFVTLKEGFNH